MICRVILDTHVVLELLLWDSPRHTLLREKLAASELRWIRDDAILDEWRRVLTYTDLALEQTTQQSNIELYLQQTTDVETLIDRCDIPDDLPRCRDVDDQKFLALAWQSNASWLLTRDKKLRKIGKHKRYRERFKVTTPEEWVLKQVRMPRSL
jgi:uncharacterized protein